MNDCVFVGHRWPRYVENTTLVAARGPDLTMMLFPVAGGTPVTMKGFATNDRPIRWSKDGAAIFAFTRGVLPSHIHRIDLATGDRTLWTELSPTDPTGVEGLTAVRMTDDERGYAYSYSQRLNDLFVVEGLF